MIAEFISIAIGLVLIRFLRALPMHGVVVALALCGDLIGFAPFNRPVARIFLGDVCSPPIALLFAWQLILVAGHGHLLAALVLPLYYLADATLTLLCRMANREPQAHCTLNQIAIVRGWSGSEIASSVFAANLLLVALAAASTMWPGPSGVVAALGGGTALLGSLP
jgi:UDP-N-acetylmuramyl pentapeptide phosphotransferase/UDP-N-acetylglucosamine-1-phosphate transferase